MSERQERREILARVRNGELTADEGARLLRGGAAAGQRAALESQLCRIVARVAQVPAHTVLPGEPLERYGFDSVMAVEVVRLLQDDFGPLHSTLLFEHPTVGALAAYLAAEHPQATRRLVAAPSDGARTAPAHGAGPEPTPAAPAAAAAATTAGPPGGKDGDDIAIVGLSGRFPGAGNLAEFWANLEAGRDCVTEIPADRWDHADVFDPEPGTPGKSYGKWGGFLDGVDRFDAAFFRLSPREAERMDPQERLLLEEVWHALEDAGLPRRRLAGRPVGVYVGVMGSHYHLWQADEAAKGNPLHLSSSYGTIANRVSHFFDFRGPSMAVDTMCSSSLTALHLACEALRHGDIEVAVAGGVNVSVHPTKFVDLAQGRFLSSDGRCRSFGEGGDGYVPGEGVAVAVLKPLSAAVADGDRVLAVVKASGIGHGGKTNGYSVPNPHEQTRRIVETVRRAGVDPADIGYVEAHGTGTVLGDPIEVTALDRALSGRDPADPCAVGSVKSNIGHLEAAAGIAGITKVVLQLRHRKLVPSLHAERLNPNIDFAGTGLRVQRSLQRWEPRNGTRIAGVSSFGMGGASAHVVLAEHRGTTLPAAGTAPGAQLIVLSARSEERLRVYADVLAEHVARWDRTGAPDPDAPDADAPARMASLGHTLRAGREPLDERLAFLAETPADVVRTLREFARTGAGQGIARGAVDRGAAPIAAGTVAALVERRDLAGLAELWVRSDAVDVSTVDAPAEGAVVPKLALPGYPFLRERHWPELTGARRLGERVHPLLDRNVSTFAGQRFEATITGGSRWVTEHRVAGRPLLPAAALAEMVLAAARLSGLEGAVRLTGTVWEAPVEVAPGTSRTLTVALRREEGHTTYTVASGDGVHARGRVQTGERAAAERLDIDGLLATFGAPADGADCYRAFERRGLSYGPLLRVLDQVRAADGRALGRIRLSGGAAPGAFCLPPALLDGAFQTLIAFADGERATEVPVAADVIAVDGEPPAEAWVHARRRPGAADVYDLRLADDTGRVIVRVDGLVVRPVAGAVHRPVVMEPVWRQSTPPALPASTGPATLLVFDSGDPLDPVVPAPGPVVRVRPAAEFGRPAPDVIEINPEIDGHYVRLLDVVAAEGPAVGSVVHAWSLGTPGGREPGPGDLRLGFHSVRALATALLGRRPVPSVRLVFVHRGDAPVDTAVAAFGRTLAAEAPALVLTTLAVPGEPGELVAELAGSGPAGAEVRYVGGVRQVRELTEAAVPHAGGLLRAGGVYLLTGALGGLGRALARHLAERYGARLVLSGRTAAGPASAALVEELAAAGGAAVYVAADCATPSGARSLADEARQRYGRLDGVVHLAAVLRDGLLGNRHPADRDAVLGPKVWGAEQLDAATAGDDLDFFALFSSASSVFPVPGQCDYAYANAYLDAFAERRAATRAGTTVSIAWPLWRDGGMDIDDAAKDRAEQELGWVPLPVPDGMALFERLLAAGMPRPAVFYGHRERILRTLRPAAEPAPATVPAALPPSDPPSASADPGPLADELRAWLTGVLAAELKLPADRLDPHELFDQLGLESVMVMNLTRHLDTVFGQVPRTLFYEYRSVHEVTEHLLVSHPDAVAAHFGARVRPAAPVPADPPVSPKAASANAPSPARPAVPGPAPTGADRRDEPIAIVGLGGRYPMADDLAEFWANLRDGRDCITEIPAERWAHERYFEPEPGTPGKSYSKWGGFLRDIDRFDPLFFGISRRDARLMDPQERLFLQTAWHTVEDAGHDPASLAGRRVGVFAGVMYAQYQLYGADPAAQAKGFVPSSLSALVANRVSYVLGLTGPSMAVDTMCSSSLTALHLACASIRLGECDQAIAGGVSAILHPNRYLQLSQARFVSTDGRCRSFGAGGDGFVPGEGVGAVLLKPLGDALADGDRVYAVVRGSALNHGGRSNGFTVPAPTAQRDVIAAALRSAGVRPAEIDYLEAHGTGTALGDPIEIDGLSRAFADGGAPAVRCPIGSVKSTIGHAEAAAGIAGLTKVLLQMRHRQLVPSLHADELNPHIDFGGVFEVQRKLQPWRARVVGGREMARVAAVSSFGAGGSNAHVVVEEHHAEAAAGPDEPGGPELITLSARTGEQLREVAARLADHLEPVAVPTPEPAPHPGSAAQDVRAAAGDLLGVPAEELPLDEDLVDLGFDPVTFGALAERLRPAYRTDPVAGLADCPTLGAVAELVASTGPAASGAALPRHRLRDVAYTLRVGRKPLTERLALIARDIEELRSKLLRFCAGDGCAGLFRGRIDEGAKQWRALLDGAAGEDFLQAVRASGDLGRLAGLWVGGIDLAASAGDDSGARRVGLPGYPFDRERFWVPETDASETGTAAPAEREPSPADS